MDDNLPQVGAPDPELNTSPIIDEGEYDEHEGGFGLEAESGVCYFNNEAFPIGTYVRSGSEILRCTERGVWVRQVDSR
jgi:hypothetical protein